MTTEWDAVEENVELIAGIEGAVRQLVRLLPPEIRDALGWVAPNDTPAQIARTAIAAYREYTERYDQSPEEATEAAVHEIAGGGAGIVEAAMAVER